MKYRVSREGFDFKAKTIRMLVDEQGVAWLVAKDVCHMLGLKNVTRALACVDEASQGKRIFTTSGGNQRLSVININGVLSLVGENPKVIDRLSQEFAEAFLPVLQDLEKENRPVVKKNPFSWFLTLIKKVIAWARRLGR